MLDIKLIRKQKEAIEKKLQSKEPNIHLNEVVMLDDHIREIKTEVEQLKASRNDFSKKIGELKQKGQASDEFMKQVAEINARITLLDRELENLEAQLLDALSRLPNIPMDDVKVSQDKNDNVCIKTVGKKTDFNFVPKNHLELNEKLHLFDFKRSAKTSGTGWPAYRGLGARLEWALLNYMVDVQIKNGFTFWLPPLMVRPQIMFGSGQIPKFDGQYYRINDEDNELYLIPTSEVVLNGLHYDEIFEEQDLPVKYSAYTPCFRREAGAAGAQERGLIRVHQFNKVEMFCFCTPEDSPHMFEQMLVSAEEILQGLQLHYRNMLLVTGDMSFTAAKTVDIEAWLPGQNRYYEVSSVSNCTDYAARRSQIRYQGKGKSSKPEFVHTLNGSGLATSRLMVALLENNQNPDGSINLPPILQERLGQEKLVPESE